jgi:hypothetical protein
MKWTPTPSRIVTRPTMTRLMDAGLVELDTDDED